jgi:hypothetical protein
MHCVKLLGQRLSAPDFDRQVAELQVRIAVLNGFTAAESAQVMPLIPPRPVSSSRAPDAGAGCCRS